MGKVISGIIATVIGGIITYIIVNFIFEPGVTKNIVYNVNSISNV